MSIAALVRRLADVGASSEAIAIAVEAIEAEQSRTADRRAQAAARKARQRERERDSHVTVTALSQDTPSPKKETSPTPPKEKTTPSHSPSSASAFAQFWAIYPNRVGKRDAESAFSRALTRSDLPTILAGLRRYASKTDDRPWCNPATWLNQGRWDDEPAASTPQQRGGAPPKPKTISDMFRDDARQMGIIPNEQPTSPPERRVEAGDRDREGGSPGIARRFAVPADVFGSFGPR